MNKCAEIVDVFRIHDGWWLNTLCPYCEELHIVYAGIADEPVIPPAWYLKAPCNGEDYMINSFVPAGLIIKMCEEGTA